jgi:H+-transporting ATPase
MTATAKKSFVGKTASLVTGSKDQGHFQKVMNVIGTTLLVLVVMYAVPSF